MRHRVRPAQLLHKTPPSSTRLKSAGPMAGHIFKRTLADGSNTRNPLICTVMNCGEVMIDERCGSSQQKSHQPRRHGPSSCVTLADSTVMLRHDLPGQGTYAELARD